jgi:hypothetical protein
VLVTLTWPVRQEDICNTKPAFGKATFSNPHDISKKFIRQYVPYPKSDLLTRKVQRQPHSVHPIDHTFSLFTPALMEEAIKRSSSSTATGPDGLALLQLKNLGLAGIGYLTELFNLSVKDAVVPAIWKLAQVLPILKPGKPANQGTLFRPISLLCPAIKISERLLLPSITALLSPDPSQHGFLADHSTNTALLPLVTQISEGFNENKPASRTAGVAIDISKAFDIVDIMLLLQQITYFDLHHNLVRWLSTYLCGRTAACISGVSVQAHLCASRGPSGVSPIALLI